jgi:hypothetical protein
MSYLLILALTCRNAAQRCALGDGVEHRCAAKKAATATE